MIDTIDEKKIRAHRAERIRGELHRGDLEAVLAVDPINLPRPHSSWPERSLSALTVCESASETAH